MFWSTDIAKETEEAARFEGLETVYLGNGKRKTLL